MAESVDIQSIIGLTVQCAGIILIMALSLFMTRSIRRKALDYWSIAWVSLSVALLALSIAFRVEGTRKLMFFLYFLGEYGFGLMLIAGCRNHATGELLTRRNGCWLLPAFPVAVGLLFISSNFNVLFIPHAAIMGIMFAKAFDVLKPARSKAQSGPGFRVMTVALALLAIDFFHYVPVMTTAEVFHLSNLGYLRFTSIYDLILEILLGFGSIMVVMDEVRHEVEVTNRELVAARDRLENIARMDPLTGALNRHAYYSLIEGGCTDEQKARGGWVVVIDIDNLKPINDSFGHSAGDSAIKAVATCIRSVAGIDDMLFRWGGDEFLILSFESSEVEVGNRTARLDSMLAETLLPGLPLSVKTIVSHGFAKFEDLSQVRRALEQADIAMYASKQARKAHCRGLPSHSPNPSQQPPTPARGLLELQAG